MLANPPIKAGSRKANSLHQSPLRPTPQEGYEKYGY